MPVSHAPLAKRLYPSAGSLYPVRAYSYLNGSAVECLEAGAYVTTRTLIVWPGLATRDRARRLRRINRTIAEAAGLAIFLIGHLPAIRPLYGDWARDACLLEAGYIGQTLSQAGLA